ncbi:MAG TPA: hypothetical protein VGI75_10970, partial [Pirellulales bacterium]
RAERLASLHGLTLGPVLSVQEIMVSGDDTIVRQQQPWETSSDPTIPNRSELTAESMSGGVFRVRLSVRFGIDAGEKGDKKVAAQAAFDSHAPDMQASTTNMTQTATAAR